MRLMKCSLLMVCRFTVFYMCFYCFLSLSFFLSSSLFSSFSLSPFLSPFYCQIKGLLQGIQLTMGRMGEVPRSGYRGRDAELRCPLQACHCPGTLCAAAGSSAFTFHTKSSRVCFDDKQGHHLFPLN